MNIRELAAEFNKVQAAYDASDFHDPENHVNIEPGWEDDLFVITEFEGKQRRFVARKIHDGSYFVTEPRLTDFPDLPIGAEFTLTKDSRQILRKKTETSYEFTEEVPVYNPKKFVVYRRVD